MNYIAFHKPLNVVSSRVVTKVSPGKKLKKKSRTESDGIANVSIYDLAEKTSGFDVTKLGLVGRLDAMTTGAMLFTDDSKLYTALLFPEDCEDDEEKRDDENDSETLRKYKTKVYHLDVLATPHRKWGTDWSADRQTKLLEELSAPLTFRLKGIEYTTKPAEVSIVSRYRSEEHSFGGKGPRGADLGWCAKLKVVLREGKHHQIRRLASRSKLIVCALTRVSFAGGVLTIEDASLREPGSGRRLLESEVKELREAFGL